MTEKNDPYKLKRSDSQIFEEQKVIQIKEDAPRLPSSIATDTLHSTLFGAPALQPSRSDNNEQSRKGLSCGSAIILCMLFLPLTIFIISQIKGLFAR